MIVCSVSGIIKKILDILLCREGNSIEVSVISIVLDCHSCVIVVRCKNSFIFLFDLKLITTQ